MLSGGGRQALRSCKLKIERWELGLRDIIFSEWVTDGVVGNVGESETEPQQLVRLKGWGQNL